MYADDAQSCPDVVLVVIGRAPFGLLLRQKVNHEVAP